MGYQDKRKFGIFKNIPKRESRERQQVMVIKKDKKKINKIKGERPREFHYQRKKKGEKE